MTTAIAFIFLLGVLIWFHELGHFLTARLTGMRVEEFAFGFGPKLVTLFRRKGTDFNVRLIPLGGFVRIAGMEPGQEEILDGYQAQAAWKRALVVLAGPVMSFILGAVVFMGMGIFWGFADPINSLNRIGQVIPQTEAYRMGLRAGDYILQIDQTKVTRGQQMIQLIHSNPGQSVDLVVRRNGKTLTKTGVPRWSVRFAGASWSFQTGDRAVVNEDHSGSELKKTGLQHGDVLLAFGGTSIRGGRQFVEAIEANDGKPARLEILRNGKKLTLTLRPAIRWVKYPDGLRWVFPGSYMDIDSPAEAATARKLGFEYGDVLISISGKKIKSGEAMVKTLEKGADQPAKLIFQRGEKRHTIVAKGELGPPEIGYHDAIGLLGFTPAPRLVKTSLGESIKRGLQAPLGILMAFVQVFSSKRGLSEGVGGPILIAKMTASSVALGPYYYIGLIGSLSMSLAFINLMPIPVLDGGHLLVLAIERIRRKRLTPQQMATFQMIGLTIIISLIITIFYSDILKIVEGKVPQ